MSVKPSPIVCDICGIEKQSANHWWWVRLDGKTFRAGSLKTQRAPSPKDQHACGSNHAGTLFQRFLSTGTLEMEMHPQAEKTEGLGNENQGEVQVENEVGRQEGSTPAND